MKTRPNVPSILIFTLLVSFSLRPFSARAQENSRSDIPNFKMNGNVALLTNFVEHGLTQTDGDPSLQGAFGFNFGPQFKMGVWGSNVNYNSTEHFLLKANAELRVILSSWTDFRLGYNSNHYFKTTTRNGNTTYFVITSHGFRIRYEKETNWNGSDSSSTYYSFGKSFDLSQSWKWDLEAGYTMLKDVPNMENYFDARMSFFYKSDSNNITYQLSATGTSIPSQFSNGQGNTFVYAGASTSF